MRTIFTVLAAGAFFALATAHPAYSGEKHECAGEACNILHKGHVRGRIPAACVSIPFVKEKYGYVALFVLRHFDPEKARQSDEGLRVQLANAIFEDSKVAGRIDDFCRNAQHFAGGNWVVLCDEHRWGAIAGESLRYAILHGRPPKNGRVHIGTHV